MDTRQTIINSIKKITGANEIKLEVPEREEFGEFSTNIAMQLSASAKEKGQSTNINKNLVIQQYNSPRELAEAIVKQLQKDKALMKQVDRIDIAGFGFINFYLKDDVLLQNMQKVLDSNEKYGSSSLGKSKKVVIDYSAPNIAKRFSIGHLRSTVIGQSLYNLYSFLGYEVIGDNHLGDWGTQFGTLLHQITAKNLVAENLSIDELEKLYVDFNKETEEKPDLRDEARKWFKKLEDGDSKAREIWKILITKSMEEFNRVYELLNVHIDEVYGESSYEDIMPEVIFDATEKGLAKESEGAVIIEIPGLSVPLILVKRDGATTYATRDLATLKFRKEKWDPEIIVYEVSVEQTLHFQQVFAAARLLGYVNPTTELIHTKHGWYLGEDGKKFSTRKGKTVKLDDILEEAVERAKKLSGGDGDLAKKVGVGAIKYFDLSHNVQSDIVFSWEKMFLMEGNSGPYLQYTYARTQSVLRKANIQISSFQFPFNNSKDSKQESAGIGKLEINSEEHSVLRTLSQFPEVVETAAKTYSPNLVCNYLYLLAQKYNSFYNDYRILSDNKEELPEDTSNFRIALTYATGQVLKNGLGLLGIEAPERM